MRSEQFVWLYQSCKSERVSVWLCCQILALWVTLHLGNVHSVHIGGRVFLYFSNYFIFQVEVISWDKLLERLFFPVVGHVLLITSRDAYVFLFFFQRCFVLRMAVHMFSFFFQRCLVLRMAVFEGWIWCWLSSVLWLGVSQGRQLNMHIPYYCKVDRSVNHQVSACMRYFCVC